VRKTPQKISQKIFSKWVTEEHIKIETPWNNKWDWTEKISVSLEKLRRFLVLLNFFWERFTLFGWNHLKFNSWKFNITIKLIFYKIFKRKFSNQISIKIKIYISYEKKVDHKMGKNDKKVCFWWRFFIWKGLSQYAFNKNRSKILWNVGEPWGGVFSKNGKRINRQLRE